jgi:hypothetical protein
MATACSGPPYQSPALVRLDVFQRVSVRGGVGGTVWGPPPCVFRPYLHYCACNICSDGTHCVQLADTLAVSEKMKW